MEVKVTYIDENTDIDKLFAPYKNNNIFSDKLMNIHQKQLSRAIFQGKPENVVNHYRKKLAERAAQIIMLIPNEEHILMMWDEQTNGALSLARKVWNKNCKVARENAEYDAIVAGREFCTYENHPLI